VNGERTSIVRLDDGFSWVPPMYKVSRSNMTAGSSRVWGERMERLTN